MYPTANNISVQTVWGVDKLAEACCFSVHPVIAIGGITPDNCQQSIYAGAKGIAVNKVIHQNERFPEIITVLLG